MRRLATWLAVGFVAALGVAAAVAALVGVGNGDGSSAAPRSRSSSTPGPGPCRLDQLALFIRDVGDSPAVVLRHVSGPPCDVGTLRIELTVSDRTGDPVMAQNSRSAFTGGIAPDIEFIDGFTYLPRCNQEGPLVADVRAGPLTARKSLPLRGCLNPETGTTGSEPSALPHCRRGQLALSLETVGGQSAAALRHVRGGPCRLGHLRLRVFITDRHGARYELGLGDADELGGEFSSGLERVVPFSVCGEGAPFVAKTRAGPYVARGPALVGGQNCNSAVRERVFRFGTRPGVQTATVEALDPASHPLTVSIKLPRDAKIDVWMQETPGGTLMVFDHARRYECEPRGDRERCVIRFGLLEGSSAGAWTAFVRKLSSGPARIRISFAFGPALSDSQ